jgi:hypothetical protein
MITYSYTVRDIRRLIAESSNEFKARMGNNVETENKRNNEKSYKETEKHVKDFNGKITQKERAEAVKPDSNKTTLDYNPIVEPDETYKKRVQAQAKGYASELEEKNKIEKGGAEFDKEGKIKKAYNQSRDKAEANKKIVQKSGLTAREMPDKAFDKNHLDENQKPKTKRLFFKHSRFINEAQVLTRVPEEYKVDGQRIIMTDVANNEYIVECVKSPKSGLIETSIVSYKNDKLMNEQVDRIRQLMDYKSADEFGNRTAEERLNEQAAFSDIMKIARGQK